MSRKENVAPPDGSLSRRRYITCDDVRTLSAVVMRDVDDRLRIFLSRE